MRYWLVGVWAATRHVRAAVRRRLPGARCVYCGLRGGPLVEHCGSGDLVCTDDDACLTRGSGLVL